MGSKEKDLRRELLRVKLEKFILLGLKMEDIPEVKGKVVIYGAGIIGKLLFRCFEKKPIYFWDSKEINSDICGTPVCSVSKGMNMIETETNITIIVTPVWDFDEIRNKIISRIGFANVLSLEELLEKL